MPQKPDNRPGDRLSALKERERAIKAAIGAERERERLRMGRERKRLISLLGAGVLEQANRDSGFKLMIQQVLKGAEIEARDREFLKKIGW
jgi:hypothetical protein